MSKQKQAKPAKPANKPAAAPKATTPAPVAPAAPAPAPVPVQAAPVVVKDPAKEKGLICCYSQLQSHAFEAIPGGMWITGRFLAETLNAVAGKSITAFTTALRSSKVAGGDAPAVVEVDELDPKADYCYVVEFKADGHTTVGCFPHMDGKPVDEWEGDELPWKVYRNWMLDPKAQADYEERTKFFVDKAKAEADAKAKAKADAEAKEKARAEAAVKKVAAAEAKVKAQADKAEAKAAKAVKPAAGAPAKPAAPTPANLAEMVKRAKKVIEDAKAAKAEKVAA